MLTNKPKLDLDKTKFLLVENEQQRSKYLSMFPVELFGVKSNPAKSAWNLGLIFDKYFTFCCSLISAVCSFCFYHIWDLHSICFYLDLDSAKVLATALVSSHLDYCNSLLFGIVVTDLTNLQRVQNRLVRIVTKSPPFTRSAALLHLLHWLPVNCRILFKISLLSYKTLHENSLFIYTPCLLHHSHPVH